MSARLSLFALALALSSSPLLSTTARAEELHEIVNPRAATGSWVADPRHVLKEFETAEIDHTIDALHQKNGAEIALVVVVDLPSGHTAKSLATHLFNTWGVGQKGQDSGVLIVFAKNARRIEVETGYGAEGVLPDGKVGAILDEHAVPWFKQGDFGTGLLRTVRAIASALSEERSFVRRTLDRVPENTRNFAIVVAIALAIVGLFLARFFWVRRPPRCPHCKQKMRLLSSQQERAYLNREDLFEEDLGSVDHMVWRCDRDREMRITRVNKWFSGYEKCHACDRMTATRSSTTTRSPTYYSTGERRVTITCRLPNCRHVRSYTEVIPRRTPPSTSSSSSRSSSFGGSSSSFGGSSSSSSSSFGGGRSGGGGAGRSW